MSGYELHMATSGPPDPERGTVTKAIQHISSAVLTKREQIAAMAMQGSIASDPEGAVKPEGHARWSVECADALLAELAKEREA